MHTYTYMCAHTQTQTHTNTWEERERGREEITSKSVELNQRMRHHILEAEGRINFPILSSMFLPFLISWGLGRFRRS